MQKIGVIGAGTMGNGIAHVSALSGLDVVLVDINAEILEQGLATTSALISTNTTSSPLNADT
jgi:3-hydroxybutyryl-CoA dehydrogenase